MLIVIKVIAAFFFIVFPTGYLFCKYFLPDELREHLLLISPIAGAAVVFIILGLADFFGFAAGKFILPYSITFFILFLVSLVFGERKLNSKNLAIVILAIIFFLLVMLPMFKAGYVSIYRGATDQIVYSSVGDWLMNNSSRQAVPFANTKPHYAFVSMLVESGGRLGPMFLLAGINKLVNSYSLKTFQTISSLFYFLAIIGVFSFASITLNFNKTTAFLSAFIFGASTLVVHGNANGFLSQEMSLAFIPLAITFGIYFFNNFSYKSLLFYALFISAIILVYPESLSLLYVIALPLIGFIRLLIKEKKDYIKRSLPWIALLTALIVIITFPSIIRFVTTVRWNLYDAPLDQFTTAKARARTGDIRYYTPQTEMAGLGAHLHGLTNVDFKIIGLFLVWTPYIIAVFLIFIYLRNKRDWILLSGIAIYILFVILSYVLTFPYLLYKHMAQSVFIFSVALAGGLYYFYQTGKPRLKAIAVNTFVLSLIFASFVSFIFPQLIFEVYGANKDVFELEQIKKYVKPTDHLAILPNHSVTFMWIIYLLDDYSNLETTSVKIWDYYYNYDGEPRLLSNMSTRATFFLVEKKLGEQKIALLKNIGKPIWQNSSYVLIKRKNNMGLTKIRSIISKIEGNYLTPGAY